MSKCPHHHHISQPLLEKIFCINLGSFFSSPIAPPGFPASRVSVYFFVWGEGGRWRGVHSTIDRGVVGTIGATATTTKLFPPPFPRSAGQKLNFLSLFPPHALRDISLNVLALIQLCAQSSSSSFLPSSSFSLILVPLRGCYTHWLTERIGSKEQEEEDGDIFEMGVVQLTPKTLISRADLCILAIKGDLM